jgi:hypothetical protein
MRAGVTIGKQHRKQRRWRMQRHVRKRGGSGEINEIGVMASVIWRQKRKRSVALGGIWHEQRQNGRMALAQRHEISASAWRKAAAHGSGSISA